MPLLWILIRILPRPKSTPWVLLTSAPALLFLLVSRAIAQSPATPDIGFVFEGIRDINTVALTTFEFTGECPGRSSPEIRTWFQSEQTLPARRRRVLIRNVTPGVRPDAQPFTDREYDEGSISEPFLVEFGTQHSNRKLRVLEGENEFRYEITERRNVIESGTFFVLFENTVQTQVRNSTYQSQQVCANTSVALSTCADVRTSNRWTCPDGNILRQETIPPGPVRTVLANQMFYPVSYEVAGRVYRLQPGEEQILTGNSFSSILIIHPQTGLTTSRSLTPGTRYRFTNISSGPSLAEWYNR